MTALNAGVLESVMCHGKQSSFITEFVNCLPLEFVCVCVRSHGFFTT